jgi:hypothetical protein
MCHRGVFVEVCVKNPGSYKAGILSKVPKNRGSSADAEGSVVSVSYVDPQKEDYNAQKTD